MSLALVVRASAFLVVLAASVVGPVEAAALVAARADYVQAPPPGKRQPDDPQVTAPRAVALPEDSSPHPVAFGLKQKHGDVFALTVTATSSDPALLPAGGLVLGGSGSARTITIAPAPDRNGTATVQLVATDPQGRMGQASFAVTVAAVNDPPALSPLAPITVEAGTSSAASAFTLSDVDNSPATLGVTATSSNPGVLPASALVLGGAGASRTLVVQPPGGQGGTTTVTVAVSDGVATTNTTVQVTVTPSPPTRTPPVISSIAAQTMAEDTIANVPFTVSDPDGPVTSLRLAVGVTQPQLLPTGSVQFGGSGASRTLQISPPANANGATAVTVTATDADGLSASSTFTLAVVPVNDPPAIGLIPDQQTAEDTPTPAIPFAISDPDDPSNPSFGLALHGSSSNQALVSDGAIVFGGAGTARTVSVAPELGQSGTTVISVQVSDAGGLSAVETFALTVTSVPCTNALTPAALTIGATGGTATIQVDTAGRASCGWTASTADAWITVVSPAPGTIAFGRGGVQLSVAPNTGPQPRTGAVSVGTQQLAVSQAGQPAGGDGDADGLPDAWEQQFGLDPNSGAAADGAAGDPDGDGVANLDEFRNGTHPRGFVTRFLAEGASGAFFHTQLAFANPSQTPALVLLHFLRDDGQRFEEYLVVPPTSRRTMDPGAMVAGLASAAFSTELESDGEVVFDRTMRWDAAGYGAHAESSILRPRTTWYLAEGATHSGFLLFYLIQNPNASTATVTISYLLPSPSQPVVRTYAVRPYSRFSVWVGTSPADPALQNVDVSAVLDSTLPVVVERAMYLSRPGEVMAAGHDGAAIEAPATDWYLAEGATSAFFNTFVLLANPTAADATVEVRFLRETGGPLAYVDDPRTGAATFVLKGNSRKTIWANLVPGLGNAGFSTRVRVVNGAPILVERAMWWPGTAASWYESHVAAATTTAGESWGMADGEAGGPAAVETFVLVANPSSAAARVRTTLLFEDGTTAAREDVVAANSRRTLWISATPFLDAQGRTVPVAGQRFGIVVDSVANQVSGPVAPTPIVVERAMYWDANGERWAAGTGLVATKLR